MDNFMGMPIEKIRLIDRWMKENFTSSMVLDEMYKRGFEAGRQMEQELLRLTLEDVKKVFEDQRG